MTPSGAADDGHARPYLSSLLHQRKTHCSVQKKEAENLHSLLALFQEFIEVAPLLAFDKVLIEPIHALETGKEAYWFTLSLDVVQGNGMLLTYLLEPHKYHFDTGVQEFSIQSNGDYVVATFFAPGDTSDPLPPRKKVLENLSIHHLRLKCQYVAYEVERYNEQLRHLFRYDSTGF